MPHGPCRTPPLSSKVNLRSLPRRYGYEVPQSPICHDWLSGCRDDYPCLALSIAASSDHLERIKHHTRELEKAIRDAYGVEVKVLTFGLDRNEATDMRPLVFVAAETPYKPYSKGSGA
jgi:hypothetical protein